jgi:hypothetical protein
MEKRKILPQPRIEPRSFRPLELSRLLNYKELNKEYFVLVISLPAKPNCTVIKYEYTLHRKEGTIWEGQE